MRIAIIGAGMAGLACGEALRERDHEIALFDKGRRPGGRMSTKTLATPLGDAAFDYGSPYLTAREPTFRARVERWRKAGVVVPWEAAEPNAWVGTPGMSAPVADLAARLDVRWSTRATSLLRDDRRWRLHGEGIDLGCFDAAVVAIPAEQVGALIGEHDADMAALAAAAPSAPCWTVMAAFAEPLPVQADVARERGDIAWTCRENAKPGRLGPERWVIHAAPAWSAERLEEDCSTIVAGLLAAFAGAIGSSGLPELLASSAHRWRYARSGRAGVRCCWRGDLALGLCGDWLIGPEVEAAWLSGSQLAHEIAAMHL